MDTSFVTKSARPDTSALAGGYPLGSEGGKVPDNYTGHPLQYLQTEILLLNS